MVDPEGADTTIGREEKMLKISQQDRISCLEQDVWRFQIFPFLTPNLRTYMSVLLTCKAFYRSLRQDNHFMYTRVWLKPEGQRFEEEIQWGDWFSEEHSDLVDFWQAIHKNDMTTFNNLYQNCRPFLHAVRYHEIDATGEPDVSKFPRDVVLMLLRNSAVTLADELPDALRQDREFVLMGVRWYPEMLEFASEEFKKDREVVMAAVSAFPNDEFDKEELSLRYASDNLKNDKEIVMAAYRSCPASFHHASDELKRDKEFILELIESRVDQDNYDYHIFMDLSDEVLNDRDFILRVVKVDESALDYLPEVFKNDEVKAHNNVPGSCQRCK